MTRGGKGIPGVLWLGEALGQQREGCGHLKWHAASHPQLDRSTREVELGLDYGTPTMNLAGQNLKFENGHWIAGVLVSWRVVWQDGGRKLSL